MSGDAKTGPAKAGEPQGSEATPQTAGRGGAAGDGPAAGELLAGLTNPLAEDLRTERTPDPCILVIFGASGDLTRRKLIPALYHLARERRLPAGFAVIGVARNAMDHDQFRKAMHDAIVQFDHLPTKDEPLWESFARGLYYLTEDFADPDIDSHLQELLKKVEKERNTGPNRIFYLATPPSVYPELIQQIGAGGFVNEDTGKPGWTRIVVEKPFGHDLKSAQDLNTEIAKVFREEQVYRIDHYLGKETVQNVLVFRLANGIFEPIWNRRYIDHVQITAAESLGMEGRGGYYEEAGLVRDMIQNHVLQVLCLTAMEPPASFDADAVRDEKAKVLRAIHPLKPEQVAQFAARGQYGPGWAAGKKVAGYRKEPGVDPHSNQQTFGAIKFQIDNWRWSGVPWYVRSGKRLAKRVTEIAIQFKRAPLALFSETEQQQMEPNVLAMQIQPDEGISLKFAAKIPGATMHMRDVAMDFRYSAAFGGESPEAYERLLLDCLLGDRTLFTRRDSVEAAWSLVTPILQAWESSKESPPLYEAGTWGPAEADQLLARDGRHWRRL